MLWLPVDFNVISKGFKGNENWKQDNSGTEEHFFFAILD